MDKVTGLEFAVSSQPKHDDERRPRVLGQAIDGGQAEADAIAGAAKRGLQLNPGRVGGALIERQRLAGRRHRELYDEIPTHDVDDALIAVEPCALAEHFELPFADAADAIGI
ncbi:MAG: hypothetical protein HC829_01480 [Bacteroidales bacterium]|nr:hypothetical protein [Bacteroidales bacterium]